MKSFPSPLTAPIDITSAIDVAQDSLSYSVDAWQRGILFVDVLRQRGDRYHEHAAKAAPHVLKFGCELLIDGRELPRPVNYVLVRVTPPAGVEVDPRKRPFVIVDPRAGHGPGIGGFKPESEIGVAFNAGHPCYFIGFLPDPVPGQTIEDIALAEGMFLEHVITLHPEAQGKPAVIGNCQAGWAVMMLAAMRPELFGPIIVAGSPLSYWAGVYGKNPMRYTGGLLGGSWLTALAGDLGNGKFDGAWLVTNFENLNPANTYWTKLYNLYSKVDTEGPRFLEFEQWWGGHVLLNAGEMQSIADDLFIGNKLASGAIRASDGSRVDLRNIKSPILVFCSKADNITPPAQALSWILDLYESIDDIRTHGQTIVYAVHETIGHLGIFVSGSVAKKEHDEFAHNIDLIDALPPGLYEAVMIATKPSDAHADLFGGDYLVRFEARGLDHIKALCGDSDDERKFAAVARVSEINLGLYRMFLQPWVRLWANDFAAEWMRFAHPARLQYEMFASANPFVKLFQLPEELTIGDRKKVAKENVYWQAQECVAHYIETSLDAYRDARDRMAETLFHAVYGSPVLQACVGLRGSEADTRQPGRDVAHLARVAERVAELRSRIADGGAREGLIRALIYIRMPDGKVDERGFNFLRRLRDEAGQGLNLADFKRVLREQFFMLLLDEHGAVAAIPEMLAREPELAADLQTTLRQLIDVVGTESAAAKRRLSEIDAMLEHAERKKPRAARSKPEGNHQARARH